MNPEFLVDGVLRSVLGRLKNPPVPRSTPVAKRVVSRTTCPTPRVRSRVR